MGLKVNDFKDGMRICSQHVMEKNHTKTFNIERKKKKMKLNLTFDVPKGTGISYQCEMANGNRMTTAKDRVVLNEWDKHYEEMKEKYGESPAKRILELERTCQQLIEAKSPTETSSHLPSISLSSHFCLSQHELSPIQTKQTRRFKSSCEIKSDRIKTKRTTIDTVSIPSIFPNTLPDSEIKRRTGFTSEMSMLSFIMIVCNGEINIMRETASDVLTWYEEWLYYFEAVWGRTHTRWEDLAAMFKISDRKIGRKVFDSKTYLILRCRSSWPVFVSLNEDKILRKEKWNDKYENKRVIMWDDTNIPFCFKPSSAKNQRLTYSSYYSMNCAKGGVFLQLCGWMGVAELWCGGISDTIYIEKEKILERQNDFANKDRVGNAIVPTSRI